MKIGYAMIRNPTDPLEDQICSLKEYGCELIYKELIYDKESGRIALRDLLEDLTENSTVVIERLSTISATMEAPLGFLDVLIDKKCTLLITSSDKNYSWENLNQLKLTWNDLLKFREKSKSRRTLYGLSKRKKKTT